MSIVDPFDDAPPSADAPSSFVPAATSFVPNAAAASQFDATPVASIEQLSSESSVATYASPLSSPAPGPEHSQMSPMPHALLPNAPPTAAAVAFPSDDAVLTPRTLARKIAAHQEREAPEFDETSTFEHPTFDEQAVATSPDDARAPRFVCVLGTYRLKGEGLDTHTRYEIATKWHPRVVAESAAAIAAVKERKQSIEKQEEEEQVAASVSASAPSSSDSPAPIKISPTSKVGRRYTDFVTLQSLLTALYPSHLIPCLPPKGLLQRFDEEFITERRRGLQRFLLDLSQQPTLAADRLVAEFLVASNRDWETTAAGAIQTHHLGGAKNNWLVKGTMNFGSKLLDIAHDALGQSAGGASEEEYAHDEFHRLTQDSQIYHRQLHAQYTDLQTAMETVHRAESEMADAWLTLYDGFEASDDALQASRIAHTHDLLGLEFAQLLPLTQRIGILASRKADTGALDSTPTAGAVSASIAGLCATLRHCVGMFGQIQELFKRRQTVSHAVHTAAEQVKKAALELDAMRARIARGEKSTEDEGALQGRLTQCEAILRDRQASLASFHSTAEEAIRAYTRARRHELRARVVAYMRAQIAHEASVTAHWQRLLDGLAR